MLESEPHESDLMLARAAKNAFARAEHLQALCLAAQDVAQAAEASRACDHAERSMRQHLLVLDRLQRGRRAERVQQRHRDAGRRAERACELREALGRVIWEERCEAVERMDLYDELQALIHPDAAPDDFADRPFKVQVLELADALGLSRETAANWQALPEIDLLEEDGAEAGPEAGADFARLPHAERRAAFVRAGLLPDSS